ncbi:MAG: recombinase family protein [Ruminococcaceae bacterium]|nr:recombinase family protein [Oscillospiraceae bacterium]
MSEISIVTPKITARTKRVAAYARVSTEDECMVNSLAAQTSYFSGLIRNDPDWEFAGVYSDEGISGTSEKRRKGFARMLEDCEQGKIDIILTKSISRFARNTVTLLETVRHLKSIGVEVRFERENLSTFDASGELMLTVLTSFAQEESRSTSENVKWGIRRGFEAGQMNAFVLYGYRSVNGKLQVVPEEAAVVRLIFENYLNGFTAAKTEKQLEEMGVKSYRGKHFSKDAIRKILKQEKYTGNAMLQKYYIENHITHRKRKNRGELPRYFVENSHEPIISVEIFERVQQEIKRRRELGIFASGAVETSCFTSKIRCGLCGKNYRRHKRTSKNGTETVRWRCSLKKTCGCNACGGEDIPEDDLKYACALAMGREEFDENEFRENVTGISVTRGSILEFTLADKRRLLINWRCL